MKRRLHRRNLLALASAGALVGVGGCLDELEGDGNAHGADGTRSNGNDNGEETEDDEQMREDGERDDEPDAVGALVRGNTRFAFDLFSTLVAEEPEADHFVSPFSISMALAMTWVGARGETEAEMADVLHFPFGQTDLHPGFDALVQELDERSEPENETSGDPFELAVANALWPVEGAPVEEEFLETVDAHYDAEPTPLAFGTDPEGAADAINDWVAEETDEKIEEIVEPGGFDDRTAMVLTNAVYFLAGWAEEFDENETRDAPFTALDGTTAEVAVMHQTETFPYAAVDGHQLVELPYVGEETGIVVLVPAADEFETFEESLNADRLDELLAELKEERGTVELPRFELEGSYELPDTLERLGIETAFDPDRSNLTGIIDREDLHIDDVRHEAAVTVDEEGTEAAAATAVEVGIESAPPPATFELTVDRPFLFLLRDRPTGAVLFLGRVVTVPDDPE